jgi:hypothetical protein
LKDAWYIISNACHRCTTNILPWSFLGIFMLVYLVGIGMF